MKASAARLVEEARLSAVWLTDRRCFLGCGFVLAPRTVLTAAHVLRAADGPVTAHSHLGELLGSEQRLYPAEHGDGKHYAHPDLALLTVPAIPGLPGAPLTAEDIPPGGTGLRVWGFSEHTPEPGVHPDSLLLRVVGPAAEYVRVNQDAILRGFSGSMVVRTDHGTVCGVLKANRTVGAVSDGGWYTPLSALGTALAEDDPLRAALPRPAAAALSSARSPLSALSALELLVAAFEAVPGMDDPEYRRELIRTAEAELGHALHVAHRSRMREHVLAMIEAARADQDRQRAGRAFAGAAAVLSPDTRAAARLRDVLEAEL